MVTPGSLESSLSSPLEGVGGQRLQDPGPRQGNSLPNSLLLGASQACGSSKARLSLKRPAGGTACEGSVQGRKAGTENLGRPEAEWEGRSLGPLPR